MSFGQETSEISLFDPLAHSNEKRLRIFDKVKEFIPMRIQGQKVAFDPKYFWYFIKNLWGLYANPMEG